MKQLAALYTLLEASADAQEQQAALRNYFRATPPADAAWAVLLLAGSKPGPTLAARLIRAAAREAAGLAEWLFEASYQAVGDLAETVALVLPDPVSGHALGHASGHALGNALGHTLEAPRDDSLAIWMTQRLPSLRGQTPQRQAELLQQWWQGQERASRHLLTQLLSAGTRLRIAPPLLQAALADAADLDPRLMAQRLADYLGASAPPAASRYRSLLSPAGTDEGGGIGQPYPFQACQALVADGADGTDSANSANSTLSLTAQLGDCNDWIAEWRYDGVRAQIVRRQGRVWIWTLANELITDRCPEIETAALALPDGSVLDGELLVWRDDAAQPDPFAALQTRLAGKAVSKKQPSQAPLRFVAFDLLESDGVDLRAHALTQRRERLAITLKHCGAGLAMARPLPARSWAERVDLWHQARDHGATGLVLKPAEGRYGSDAGWQTWQSAPCRITAVLLYVQASAQGGAQVRAQVSAQPGAARDAGQGTDYSFAVWSRPPASAAEADEVLQRIARGEPAGELQLVACAKTAEGLSDDDARQVDAIIRATVVQKFGPVRTLAPQLVMQLGFDAIAPSVRHKSGVVLRSVRILQRCPNRPVWQADSLAQLRSWLPVCAAPA